MPKLLFVLLSLFSALAAPPALSETVVFLGDSLTEGYQLPKEAAYPSLVETALKQKGHKDLKVVNAGISGSTSASGPGRMRWQLKGKDKPDIVVLALGANDGLRGLDPAAMKKNLGETIRLAKDAKVKVLLCGMRMPPNYGSDYGKRYEAVFPELAKEYDVPLLPFLLDGVGGEQKLNLPDGVHPNAEGYKIVAKTVLPHLEPLLANSK